MRVIEFSASPEVVSTRDDIIGEQFNRPIVGGAATGTRQLVADSIRFPPGFNHQLHRHADGDQLTIVTAGEIIAYDEQGERVVRAGSAVLFPAGEWHGVRTEVEAHILNFFPGVAAIPDAGYEESDPPVAAGPS